MGNPYFSFKRFTIHQDRCAMKVGTDGVLLGAWADIAEADRVLDIGTGTGLIALMCAQRNPNAHIVAVEIDKKSSGQAAENFERSDFSEQIESHHCNIQEYRTDDLFDEVICNPPFFSAGTPSPVYERYIARQSESLPLESLVDTVVGLMKDSGRFHLILPYRREQEMDSLCATRGLFPVKKCRVSSNVGKSPKRLLVTYGRHPGPCAIQELSIEKSERFHYTDEYIALTRDFYPKMD